MFLERGSSQRSVSQMRHFIEPGSFKKVQALQAIPPPDPPLGSAPPISLSVA